MGFSHTTRTPGPTHQLREVLVVEIPFFTGFFYTSKRRGRESLLGWLWIINFYHFNRKLVGGFKYFLFFTPTSGNDPIWLIFFKWVETTNQEMFMSPFQENSMSFRLHPLLLGAPSLAVSLVPPYQAYGQRWRALAQGVGVAPGLCWFGDVGGSGGEEAEG